MKLQHSGFAAALLATTVLCGTAQAAGTVKVGVLQSLSGTMAISEVTVKNAEVMAIDEINAAGVTLGGKKVKFVLESEDDQADPRTATIVAQKLVDEHVAPA